MVLFATIECKLTQMSNKMIWIKKGIKVKLLGWTNTKPRRFVVTCEDRKKVHSVGLMQNEQDAANQFIKDFDLQWKLVSGVRIDTDSVVFGVENV